MISMVKIASQLVDWTDVRRLVKPTQAVSDVRTNLHSKLAIEGLSHSVHETRKYDVSDHSEFS